MEQLIDIDQQFFRFVHQDLSNGFFDMVMPYIREKTTWIPLYVLLLFVLIKKFKTRVWIPIVSILLCIVLADQMSSNLIKPWIQRLRPCNEPEVSQWIRNLIQCGSGFSFTSSHATNHFAIAVVCLNILKPWFKWLPAAAIFWAALISFAQVYVGVHYPFDVIGGAILGSLIGLLCFALFHYLYRQVNH